MAKETKNVLTVDGCKKELECLIKAALFHDGSLLLVMAVIFVPMIALSVFVARTVLALGLIFALLSFAPLAVFVFRIGRDAVTLRLVKQGAFSVVKDTVRRMAKGEVPRRYSEGRVPVDVLYFTKYGRYIASGMSFELSSVGDEFYLAILRTKKERLLLAFPTKAYEFKEL